jgi:hypothetical protein
MCPLSGEPEGESVRARSRFSPLRGTVTCDGWPSTRTPCRADLRASFSTERGVDVVKRPAWGDLGATAFPQPPQTPVELFWGAWPDARRTEHDELTAHGYDADT